MFSHYLPLLARRLFGCLLIGGTFLLAVARFGSAAEPPDLFVRLLAPLEFADITVIGRITPAGAQRLLKEKLKLGSDEADAYEFLVLDSPTPVKPQKSPNADSPAKEVRIRVENVEQYQAALKRGAYALTTFDMAMEGWAARAAAVVKFASGAVESKRTLLPEQLLPAIPVEILEPEDSAAAKLLKADTTKSKTLSDYSQAGKLRKFQPVGTELRFDTNTRHYVLTELARGDFDRDGNEDALVSVAWAYRGGSGRGSSLMVIRRADPRARLAVDPLP